MTRSARRGTKGTAEGRETMERQAMKQGRDVKQLGGGKNENFKGKKRARIAERGRESVLTPCGTPVKGRQAGASCWSDSLCLTQHLWGQELLKMKLPQSKFIFSPVICKDPE